MDQNYNKNSAQDRIDQINAFEREVNQLDADGVLSLSAGQKESVSAHHQSLIKQLAESFDVDISHSDKQFSLGMRIASFLGALALAASVFFLFYQFWGLLGHFTQVSILVLAPVLTFIATLVIASKESTGYFSKLAALISFACFVLNLTMLGQIFNITPSDNAFLIWAAYGFLLAYACDARLLLVAAILSIQSFIAMRMGTWSGMYWLSFGERPENFFLPSILLFLVPVVISQRRFTNFEQIYRVFSLIIFFLSILVLSNVGQLSRFAGDPDFIEGVYQSLGFAFSAGVVWLGIKLHWGEVVNTGNVFFVLFLYTKMFDWWWEWMPKYLFFFLIGLVAILALVVLRRLRGNQEQRMEGVA